MPKKKSPPEPTIHPSLYLNNSLVLLVVSRLKSFPSIHLSPSNSTLLPSLCTPISPLPMSFYFDSDQRAFDPKYLKHCSLINNPEPDYDELLVLLSLHVFHHLSPSDQREQMEQIRCIVEEQRPEEADAVSRPRTFLELFKKLPFSDQLKFLMKFIQKFIQKFKREKQLISSFKQQEQLEIPRETNEDTKRPLGELVSSFKQLDPEHQQQLIEKVDLAPEELRNPGENDEDFRLRRFTELSRHYPHHVYKHLVSWKDPIIGEKSEDDHQQEETRDWKSCFAEFFLGFSKIWFEGQSARGQDLLIEQLSEGVEAGVTIKRLQEETEKEFKLRKFTELCKKVVDVRVQQKFLVNAKKKLELWRKDFFKRLIVEQNSDNAANLLSRLTACGFSLLSDNYQQQKIDEMSGQVGSGVQTERSPAAAEDQTRTDDEEGIRMRRFTELFNELPVHTRLDIFREFKILFLDEKRYFELIGFFRRLGSKDQAELIDKLSNKINCPLEKLSCENEEDFRLRIFEKMCREDLSTCYYFVQREAATPLQLRSTSDSCYADFLFDVSMTWFKSRCINYHRNPIQVILFGEVEFVDIIEKLPEESEEEFRLRRFRESFSRLESTSRERVVNYIVHTISQELPYALDDVDQISYGFRPKKIFRPHLTKIKLPKQEDEVPATTQDAGGEDTS